jgi:hypothetical protein
MLAAMRNRTALALFVLTALTTAALGADSNTYYLPAAAHLTGQNGSSFRSDVRVYNPSPTAATVQVTLLASTDNSSANSVTIAVPGQRAAVFSDFVADLFHLEAAGGAVRFVSDQPLVITSNLYSLAPSGTGTFGQFIAAVPGSEASLRQTIYHVRDDTEHRANLGIVNTSNTTANLTIVVYDLAGGGIAGEAIARVGPQGWVQYNQLASQLLLESLPSSLVTITSDVPVLTYASIVDNFTNDPFFVAGRND